MFGQLKKAIKVKRDNSIMMEEYKEHWESVMGNNKRFRNSNLVEEGGGNSNKSRRLGGLDWDSISNFSGV